MEFHHVSVLREETIHAVLGDPAGIYVDCTLGGGGHSNVAGAQLKGLTIEEAQEVVRKALEEITEEKESE